MAAKTKIIQDKDSDKSSTLSQQFPRTKSIPIQSPIHWVLNKDSYLRQMLIEDVENDLDGELFVMHANHEAESRINYDDQNYITELLCKLDTKKQLYIMIENRGGLTEATEAIVSLLKQRASGYKIIIPNMAKSNGTLLALSSSEIIMGCNSELGPIEPLVGHVPSSLLRQEWYKERDPLLHHEGDHAYKHTRNLAIKYLSENMLSDVPANEIIDQSSTIVDRMLNRNDYPSHGSVINHDEAKEIGLKIRYIDPENDTWKRIWLLYCMYWNDARNSNFSKIFESRNVSRSIYPPEIAR